MWLLLKAAKTSFYSAQCSLEKFVIKFEKIPTIVYYVFVNALEVQIDNLDQNVNKKGLKIPVQNMDFGHPR